jgi:spermidine/putrescine transport system permease protein
MIRDERDLWVFAGTRGIAIAVIAFLYVPIAVLIALSFNSGDTTGIWSGFSLRWYADVLGNGDLLHAMRVSLIVAVVATFVGTTAATMAALVLVRPAFAGSAAIEALINLPLVVPEIVAAIATLLFFVAAGLPLGLLSVILAHCVFVIPLAYLPIRARLSGIDPALAEAAGDLYAPPLAAFRRIVLPLIWPGIAAGATLAFIGSLGDFVVSFFVAGPGATTLPVYVFGMIRIGVTPSINAISTMLLAASVGLVTLSYGLGRLFSPSNAIGDFDR